ncbi:MAG: hypothetical protein WC536_00470 [Patescibacteria group bacterium]
MIREKIMHWTPRVLSALLTLFFLSFVLETFSPQFSWQDGLSHLILGLLTLGITILAWKKPQAGGMIFMLIGGSFLIAIKENTPAFWIIGLVPLTIGLLFYLSETRGKDQKV